MRWGTLVAALLVGCSGALDGEIATEPVSDWSFVSEAKDVAFRTANGKSFTRVLLSPVVHEGRLYLDVMTIFISGDDGLEAVLSGEGVRMRADGTIYELSATHLTDPRDIDPILPTLMRKSGVEATGVRWDPEPARYPGTQVDRWFFRLESARQTP